MIDDILLKSKNPAKKYMSKRYVDYSFVDETSMYDQNPTKRFNFGLECYEATYKCRVPKKLLEKSLITNDHSKLNEWIMDHGDTQDIWYL